jgi:hypothetical protein
MIAAAILGFVILGIGSLSTFTTRTTTFARRATAAATIARNAVEEARNTPYANLPTLDTNTDVAPLRPPVCFGKDLAPVASCNSAAAIFLRLTTVVAETPIAGLTEIRVRVRWPDDGAKPDDYGWPPPFDNVVWPYRSVKTRHAELATSVSRY